MLYDNHQIRRQDKLLAEEQALELLKNGAYGFLAMATEQGGYGVPLNYVVDDDVIYVHCATEGRKLSAVADNPNVSFCVVGQVAVVAERFTTIYESVIAFGSAVIVSDDETKRRALRLLVEKYSKPYVAEGEQAIERSLDHTGVIAIKIQSYSGKTKRASM